MSDWHECPTAAAEFRVFSAPAIIPAATPLRKYPHGNPPLRQYGTVLLALACLAGCAGKPPVADGKPADLVFVNGGIYTLDPGRPWAEAAAVRDGRIVSVGTNAEVRAADRARYPGDRPAPAAWPCPVFTTPTCIRCRRGTPCSVAISPVLTSVAGILQKDARLRPATPGVTGSSASTSISPFFPTPIPRSRSSTRPSPTVRFS